MHTPMTFDELCRGVTPAEREALVWHLAMLRFKATVHGLIRLPPDDDGPLMTDEARRQQETIQLGAPLESTTPGSAER